MHPRSPSESLQSTLWVATDPKRLHADSEGSDQPVLKFRLIWIFVKGNHVANAGPWFSCLFCIILGPGEASCMFAPFIVYTVGSVLIAVIIMLVMVNVFQCFRTKGTKGRIEENFILPQTFKTLFKVLLNV